MQESEVAYLGFSQAQAQTLSVASQSLAELGGPQAAGAIRLAREQARQLAHTLAPQQRETLRRFASGELAALMYTGMTCPGEDPVPERLPTLSALEDDARCLYLAARSQVLLELLDYRAFAFDIDNEGKQVRLVGNFKGGGSTPRHDETQGMQVELSSHAGLRLGPHTEAPYNCSVVAKEQQSPAPSALILSARWNPANEPTHVIPMRDVIEQLSGLQALALTSASFDFTRSDCFVAGQGEPERATSLLQFDANGGFALRYNSYRFSVNEHASQAAADAFDAFQSNVAKAATVPFLLQPDTALVINNRRLLVRLFGYSPFAQPVVICEDPLLVRG